MIRRTRFAPSPTGFMHIGNLRTALYEFLIAKPNGKFILRIEDTDQNRLVDNAERIIYETLRLAKLKHDEGPDVGGEFGPYVQSKRRDIYLKYALQLVQNNMAYYCFCDKDTDNPRCCLKLSQEEIEMRLKNNSFVIRQFIPDGQTTFHDEVYGSITVNNSELDDQVLIKSDGLPTYNFANVIDDHLMEITHVIRGCEYLSSTPKYNLLYEAFGWDIPTYVHLPLILDENGEKLSKRRKSSSFNDLIAEGYLPEAIVNYIALLGWSPDNNREIFSLDELIESFSISGLSKSPAVFDITKLRWMNGEYIKMMNEETFYELALPYLQTINRVVDYKALCKMAQSRVNFIHEIQNLFDFIDLLPDYSNELFVHKKMKTDKICSRVNLEHCLPVFQNTIVWNENAIKESITQLISEISVKNSQMLWPIRTALSGKETSPCGAYELAVLLGKDETLKRIQFAIEKLSCE